MCWEIAVNQTQGAAYTLSKFQFFKELLELLCKIYFQSKYACVYST